MIRFLLIAMVPLCFSLCSKQERATAIIEWSGGRRIENLDWKFNGKSIGLGEQGFAKLITKLEELDGGASLKVHYPLNLWNATLPDYDPSDPFPFLDRDDLRKKCMRVLMKKRMTVQAFSEP
jgi:hypothetical protein